MKKILLIDDDPTVIKLLTSGLKLHSYEILSALEAPVGLEMAMKSNPDIIILDIMMPVINGYNFCRLLKSEDKHKHIPIIMLTSRAGEEDKKIGQEVGADAYITKPPDIKYLLGTIKKLLEK